MPLIDKQAVLIWPFRAGTVFLNIEIDEVYGFGVEFYLPEAVAFSQDGQGLMCWIKIIEVERCDLSGSGA